MNLPDLSKLGASKMDITRIVKAARGSSMLTNPVKLTDDEISEILLSRMK